MRVSGYVIIGSAGATSGPRRRRRRRRREGRASNTPPAVAARSSQVPSQTNTHGNSDATACVESLIAIDEACTLLMLAAALITSFRASNADEEALDDDGANVASSAEVSPKMATASAKARSFPVCLVEDLFVLLLSAVVLTSPAMISSTVTDLPLALPRLPARDASALPRCEVRSLRIISASSANMASYRSSVSILQDIGDSVKTQATQLQPSRLRFVARRPADVSSRFGFFNHC
jgi:hypothetical protein